jgi:hypothetical protein
MLHDHKTFQTISAGPMTSSKLKTPEQLAALEQDRREQDKALALMLGYVAVVVFSTWVWGVQGLVGWALVSAALAGAWVLHTTRGIRGTAE